MNVLPESVLTQSAFASTAATTLPSFEHACGRRETRKAGRWGRVRECKVGVALPRRRSRAIWNQVCDVIPFESMEDHVFVESVERQMFPVPYWPAYTFLPFPDMAMVAQFPWKSSAMTLVNDLAESVDRHLGRAPVSTEYDATPPRRLVSAECIRMSRGGAATTRSKLRSGRAHDLDHLGARRLEPAR